MGESAALTLCSIAETRAGLKYICLNKSLKIASGKKGAWDASARRPESRKRSFFRDPAFPARSWPRLRSVRSLIGHGWHHPQGQPSSHPDDVIRAEASQWCNAGRAGSSSTHPPFFISFFLDHLSFSNQTKKKSLLHLFISPQTQGAEICS